jgi:hypothetical protein
MGPSRAPGDELAQWAAEHAPALTERAEAEAVAVLREALVAAALAETERRGRITARVPADAGRPVAAEEESERGELLWAYCVLRADDRHPKGLSGVHAGSEVRSAESAGLAALVSSVPRAEFASEPLRRNLNDLRWLERVARAHEAVLEATLQRSTIVPLRMCTIYESDESVRQMLDREHDAFAEALGALEGRWEWAVKVLADTDRLMEAVRVRSDGVSAFERELADHGEGGAYMLRRRRERQRREAADSLAAEVAEQVHARLQDWAVDATSRPPQNRELSGHQGEMLLNGAYLVDRDRVGELRTLVAELEARHHELGIRIELTGPWPPYNFLAPGDAAGVA